MMFAILCAVAGAEASARHSPTEAGQDPDHEDAGQDPGQDPSQDPSPNVSAKLGDGVTISSRDDAYSLNIRGRIQGRFTLAADANDLGNAVPEFLIRRMRLTFEGHLLSPTLRFNVQLAFAPLDMEPDLPIPLRDAYVTWNGHRDVNFRFGQQKLPFSRQRMVSSSSMQLVDRSIVNGELNLDRDVGAMMFSNDLFGVDVIGYRLGIFGGDGRNRLADAPGLLIVGRVQVMPFGYFDDSREADIARTATPQLAIGMAGAFNQSSNRARSTFGDVLDARSDYLHATADIVFKWYGLSLVSEVIVRDAGTKRFDDGTLSRSGIGWVVQGGIVFLDQLEGVGRFAEVRPVGVSAIEFEREAGGGLNWYIHEHDLKIQGDYFYLFGVNPALGAHQVRVQGQVWF